MASSTPPSSSDPRPVTHTATGWRIVGREAHRLTRGLSDEEPAQPGELSPGIAEQGLLALDCTLPRSWKGRSAVEHLLDALTGELRQTWADCPRLVRDQPLRRAPSRFGGVSFTQPDAPADAWRGRLVWRW